MKLGNMGTPLLTLITLELHDLVLSFALGTIGLLRGGGSSVGRSPLGNITAATTTRSSSTTGTPSISRLEMLLSSNLDLSLIVRLRASTQRVVSITAGVTVKTL